MYPYLHPFSRLARRFGDERACMSMGWRRGGRGFGRFGGWPDDLGDGQPLRSGRKLGSGDLRLIRSATSPGDRRPAAELQRLVSRSLAHLHHCVHGTP